MFICEESTICHGVIVDYSRVDYLVVCIDKSIFGFLFTVYYLFLFKYVLHKSQ